jgi:hypothetical protein
VIYRVVSEELLFQVASITAHDYGQVIAAGGILSANNVTATRTALASVNNGQKFTISAGPATANERRRHKG